MYFTPEFPAQPRFGRPQFARYFRPPVIHDVSSRLVSSRLLATFSRRTARCVVVATKSEPRGGCHLYVLCRLIAVERLRLISIKILREKNIFR